MPQRIVNAISDYFDTLLSKILYAFGVGSVGTGASIGIANGSFTDRLFDLNNIGWEEIAAIVSIIGGISIIIQVAVNVYIKFQRLKWEKEDRGKVSD